MKKVPIGAGTIISVFGIGIAMQLVFRIVKFEPRSIRHESITDLLWHSDICKD